MREILFRGKDVRTGYWKEGSLVREWLGVDMGYTIRDVPDRFNQIAFRCIVDPKTVGQFTGLTDKNGKKIFEGDILQVKQHGETGVRTCAIYFGEYIDADSVFKDCRCIGTYLKVVDECCSIGALLDSDFEFEIIGNIHDNPELLEVDE